MNVRRSLPALAVALLLAGCSAGDAVPEEPTTPPPAPTVEQTAVVEETTVVAESTPSEEESEAVAPEPVEPVDSVEPEVPSVDPTPEPGPATSAPVQGAWTTVEIEVGSAADAAQLAGLPAGFQDFASTLVETVDEGGCQSDIVVTAHHPAGFVTGQEFAPGCGGANVVWAGNGGAWGPVLSMQALLPCTEFSNNAVPQGHPELECLDDAGAQTDW